MQNKTKPIMLKSPLMRFDQFEESFSSNHQKQTIMYPIKYLKFWGVDYPYLNVHKNCIEGCLPIPENSAVQRYLRNL